MSEENMDTILFFGYPLFLSVLFAFYAGRFQFQSKIAYIEQGVVRLFHEMGRDIEALSVTYEGSPIKENLVLLSGVLVNYGKKDIEESDIIEPIKVSLPDGCKWLQGYITEPNSRANVEILDDKSFVINTKLFRRGEFLCFDALAQLPLAENGCSPSQLLSTNILFSHRIANTGKISRSKLNLDLDRNYSHVGMMLCVVLVLIVIMLFGTNPGAGPIEILYPYTTPSGSVEYVSARPLVNNEIQLNSTSSDFRSVVSLSEFGSFHAREIKLSRTDREVSLPFFLMMIFFMTAMSFNAAYRVFKARRIAKILNIGPPPKMGLTQD